MDLRAERTGDRLYADMFVVHRIHTKFLDKLCRRYPVRSSADWLVPTYPVGNGDRIFADVCLELEEPSVVDGVGWVRMRHYER